jgi:hypothetical protein
MSAFHAARFKTARLLLCSFGGLSQTPLMLSQLPVDRFLHQADLDRRVHLGTNCNYQKKLRLELSRY